MMPAKKLIKFAFNHVPLDLLQSDVQHCAYVGAGVVVVTGRVVVVLWSVVVEAAVVAGAGVAVDGRQAIFHVGWEYEPGIQL